MKQYQQSSITAAGDPVADLPHRRCWKVLVRFLLLFTPLTLLYASVAITLYLYQASSVLSDLKALEHVHVSMATKSVQRSLRVITSDLNYLTAEHRFTELFEAQFSTRAHAHNHAGDAFSHLENDWLSYSIAKPIYDQIRFIDRAGMERIRINKNHDNPYITPKEKLQNKTDRYYFNDTLALSRGETFLSPLDLNVEHGEIERPLKPMLRAARPIFDHEDNKRGIVVLNYLAENLLNEFDVVNSQADGNHWILNSDGYWLKGPKPLAWGFMYQRQDATMAHHYPDAWHLIQSKETGQFKDKDGIWTFATIYPVDAMTGGPASNPAALTDGNQAASWKIVFRVPAQNYSMLLDQMKSEYYLSSVLLESIFTLGCLLLARAWVSKAKAKAALIKANEGLEQAVEERTLALKQEKERAEHLAFTDPLTGLNNRRAFFDLSETVDRNAKRHGHTYTVVMIDIDHFKAINDTYGHQTGDIVLKKVADSINETTRVSDISGRIGGEEFAIILPETSIDSAENLAERLRIRIADIELVSSNSCVTLTASFGVSQWHESDQTLDCVLGRADTALYKAKNGGRNQVFRASMAPSKHTAHG